MSMALDPVTHALGWACEAFHYLEQSSRPEVAVTF